MSAAVKLARLTEPEIVCIGCGCTDEHACFTESGPCSWVVTDEESGTGLCSACALKPLSELVKT